MRDFSLRHMRRQFRIRLCNDAAQPNSEGFQFQQTCKTPSWTTTDGDLWKPSQVWHKLQARIIFMVKTADSIATLQRSRNPTNKIFLGVFQGPLTTALHSHTSSFQTPTSFLLWSPVP
jgi:hypothetical protein